MKTIQLFEKFLCIALIFKSTQSYKPLKLQSKVGFRISKTVFADRQKLFQSQTKLSKSRLYAAVTTTISDEANINSQKQHRKISIPESLKNLSFLQQAVIVLSYYFMHVTYLSQIILALPFELSPSGISSVGLDSLVGILCICLSLFYCSFNRRPLSISGVLDPLKVPWRRPRYCFIHIYVYMYVHIYVYIYIHVYIYTCLFMYIYIYIYIYICLCIYVNVCIYIYIFIYVYIYI
jgi:hypothetical protein